MTTTEQNLKMAFAGESQANRKYLAFARKADQDGFPQVARLFRAAAAAETTHALAHFRILGGVKSTAENLQDAIQGENYESTVMYPEFVKEAQVDLNQKALNMFCCAMDAEKVHEDLYRKALATLDTPGDEFDYYVCPVCGFTHERIAPEKCPICGANGARFERIS